MSDPIREFLDAGGFPPVNDPESAHVRQRAQQLVRQAVGLCLVGSPETVEKLPVVWEEILYLNHHGGGVVAAIEELVCMWRRGVGLYCAFPAIGQGQPWERACQIASGLTIPAPPSAPVTFNLEVAQNDDVAIAVMATLTSELARRLREMTEILIDVQDSAGSV